MPFNFGGIGVKLAAFGVLILGILATVWRIFHKGKRAGQRDEVERQEKATKKAVQRKQKIAKDVRGRSDDELRSKLRRKTKAND